MLGLVPIVDNEKQTRNIAQFNCIHWYIWSRSNQ